MTETRYDPTSLNSRMLLAQHVLQVCLQAGFVEEAVESRGIKERVFYRGVDPSPGIRVRVFTTIEDDGTAACVREAGDDAIKVCAVYRSADRVDRGIVAITRINRVGTIEGICDRLLTRMRAVYRQSISPGKCKKCGAPLFKSKKKNMVCADLCFTKQPHRHDDDMFY